MRRALPVMAVLLLTSVALPASYTIQLQDGRIIKADDKPVVQEGLAYFFKNGLYLFLPVTAIDFEKSERVNATAAAPVMGMKLEIDDDAVSTPEAAPAGAPAVFINEEQLEIIRRRARLANEGELVGGGPVEAPSSGAMPPSAAPSGANPEDLQNRLGGLIDQRTLLYQQQSDLQSQLSTLRDKYNFSVLQGEQESLQRSMDTVQGRLGQVQSQIEDLGGQIDSVQREINATPVVIQQTASPDEGPGT
ncbi:MAG: hypothetical protein AB1347_00900 [Acidobacteriota bacterium]